MRRGWLAVAWGSSGPGSRPGRRSAQVSDAASRTGSISSSSGSTSRRSRRATPPRRRSSSSARGSLPLLDEAKKAASAERKARLAKVREALAEAEAKANLGASKVTIKGKGIRLSEAIKQLQAQSGNTITDLREQEGAEATNPALDLDIVDKPFFEALDLIAAKAGRRPRTSSPATARSA